MNKCLERVDNRHFWNPRVFSNAMIQNIAPTQELVFFFFIVTSIVYEPGTYTVGLSPLSAKRTVWSRPPTTLTQTHPGSVRRT